MSNDTGTRGLLPLCTRTLVIMMLLAGAPIHALAADAPVLRTVSIRGATAHSTARFFATYREQLGHRITPDATRAIVSAIAQLYHEAGYARPATRVDGSLAAQGILRVDVHEPRIVRVKIEGDPGGYRGQLERIGNDIMQSVPLERDAIANALAAMRRLPGLEVTATARRDVSAPNAHELVLQAAFSPVAGLVRMNNRGTDEIGRLFLLGQVGANDVLGLGESIGLAFAGASDIREYLGGGLFVDAPVGPAGSRGFAMVFRSTSEPNESPEDLDALYVRERVTLRVTHPLRMDPARSLHLIGGFEASDLAIDLDGDRIRDDRLRVVESGLRMQWRAGASTQLASSLELRMGLDALGAGLDARDRAVDLRRDDFLITQLQATSFTRIADDWSLRCDAFAQQSAYVLPDSERFKIGGERLGRGFEVAEIAGDQGLGAKLTLRRELPALAGTLGRPSLYGVYDIGAAWKQDVSGRESAATAGFGLALHGTRVSAYAEVVKPLTHADVEGKRSAALFAELSVRF